MTESEWLVSEDPAAMLSVLAPEGVFGISERKLRLWVEACRALGGRKDREWGDYDLGTDSGLRAACDAWSVCAQSVTTVDPLPGRARLLRDVAGNPFRPVTLPTEWACDCDIHSYHYPLRESCVSCGRKRSCPWLTPAALRLARGAYERECGACDGRGHVYSRSAGGYRRCTACQAVGRIDDGALDPAILGVLADALEEAGCDSEEILTHLRSPGPHVRGCWAVDLILNRE